MSIRTRTVVSLSALSVLVLVFCRPAAEAAGTEGLGWRGMNLSKDFGLFKGLQLPLHPVNGLFNFTDITPILETVPHNLLVSWDHATFKTSNRLLGPGGDTVPGVRGIDVVATLPRLLYWWPAISNVEGEHFGLESDFLLPIASVHADIGDQLGLGAGGGGVGDILFAPVVPWLINLGDHHYITASGYLGPYLILPSGNYAKTNAFNLGSNAVSIVPIIEAWIRFPFLDQLEFHPLILYGHSFGNGGFVIGGSEKANVSVTGRKRSSYRNGDMFQTNVDIHYPIGKRILDTVGAKAHPILESIRAGISVDYQKQFEPDRLDGDAITHSEEEEFALGPMAWFSQGPFIAAAKWTMNQSARNTYNFNQLWLQFTFVF